MSQDYTPGDYLVFQIESGFGLLRLLDIETLDGKRVWHVAAYRDMFLDVDMADSVLSAGSDLTVSHDHLALTTRAFESTQTARMSNAPLSESDLQGLRAWQKDPDRSVSDRSVRLHLGIR
ncbi:MAG: hypothetical protein HKN33_12385 [Pyrinomonadaceae bacterium]|nr:hypothetical protein [Pyrinomonadaceae bacterium]